jgi:hypothetical protein
MAAPSLGFWIIVAWIFAGTVLAVYMAARREHGQENDMEQLSFDAALEAKAAVLEEVAENNVDWMTEALAAADALPNGDVGTGEDIRARLLEAGLRSPRHQNAWGALLNVMCRRGLIQHTGEWRPMRSKTSHGRVTRVYVKGAVPA